MLWPKIAPGIRPYWTELLLELYIDGSCRLQVHMYKICKYSYHMLMIFSETRLSHQQHNGIMGHYTTQPAMKFYNTSQNHKA